MKENLKSEISKSIELLSKRPLKQIDINEATNVLATAIENYKSNQTPSTIQAEYNNLYAIHKNDNVVAKDLPYINREFYKHTFLPNEDVLIGFYVDTEKETYYRDNVNEI